MENKIEKQEYEPTVSVLIAAFNEEKVIKETILNKLEQDYPAEKIQIIVVSDESEDETDNLVRSLNDERVSLIRQTPRQGKTAALNLAYKEAVGEILVFSDANSIYEKDAIRQLMRNFSEEEVGYVSGKMIYVDENNSVVGDGCSAYMKYENFLRGCESRFQSIIGVDGGIDAVRKDIFVEMRADQLPDFVLPLHVLRKGYRVIYEPLAILKENALTEHGKEFKMRVRVSLRALWALHDFQDLMNPLKNPSLAWQIISHKVLRYLAWLPLVILMLSNILLMFSSSFFFLVMLMHSAFYYLSWRGYSLRESLNVPWYFSAPYYFVLINVASAMAFLKFVKGEKQVIWNPRSG